jgi:phenylpropionate dioxygenase-like ring-hydroxylating dioxygenase large terminal subunit
VSRELLVQMTRRTLAHAKAGTTAQADGVVEVPATNYHDASLWELETDRIFGRVPLVLAFSAELPDSGSYRALTVAGVPVVLIRGNDGRVRSFVNMCSHRGAIVVEEGNGRARRFACPYHAWTYDEQGTLVGIRGREMFGEIDMDTHGLTPLACEERAGVVFGTITPGVALDLDRWLVGYDDLLAHHGLAECHYVGRQSLDGPNWKIAFDGYIDQYHLPVLHREGFGDEYCDRALYDSWGPHLRMSPPDKRFLALDDVPEDQWDTRSMLGGIWTIFPHVSIASFVLDPAPGESQGRRMYMISQMFPGSTAGESHTIQTFLMPDEPGPEHEPIIEKQKDFLMHVVRDQDYYTGLRIQQAVRTGAKDHFLYGRNELGGQQFHRWVGDLVAADNDGSFASLMDSAQVMHQH